MKKILGVSAVLFMSGMMMAQEDEQWKEHINVLILRQLLKCLMKIKIEKWHWALK